MIQQGAKGNGPKGVAGVRPCTVVNLRPVRCDVCSRGALGLARTDGSEDFVQAERVPAEGIMLVQCLSTDVELRLIVIGVCEKCVATVNARRARRSPRWFVQQRNRCIARLQFR